MDRRLSLYRRGDYLMVADLFSGNGGITAVFLAIGRVSSNKFIQFPIWLFTYIFRGTPLYVQLLVLLRHVYHGNRQRHGAVERFFRSGLNCTVLALTLNTCAYTTEIFAGAIRSVPAGEIEAARAYGFVSQTVSLHYSAFRAADCATGLQ